MKGFDYTKGLEDAWRQVAEFVPKLAFAIVIFVIGWLIARLICRLIVQGLKMLRFDSVVDRSGLGRHLERAGYADAGSFVAKLVYYLVMLLVLQLALGVFGPNQISTALNGLVAFLPKLLVALIIVLLTGVVANVVADIVRPATMSVSYGPLLTRAIVAAIWVIGVFAALNQIQIAPQIVNTLFTAIVSSLSLILVIKFGVGGIWAARDRFWPKVYDAVTGETTPRP